MDLASLGLEVRSDEVEKGARSLDKLSGAAKRAEAASQGLASSSTRNAASIAREGTAATKAAAQVNTLAVASRRASVAVNDNVRRMGGSFSGLAAQFQDIGVTAAAGMSPLIIGLQQGTQIAGSMEMALQGGASAAGVFGAAIRSLLSPVSILSIGLTVLLAAGLQMADWASVAAGALNGLAGILPDIAVYAAGAAAGLALLYAPSMIMGVVQMIALMGRLAVAAVSAAAAMVAANPAGALILGLVAAVTAANIFRDELTRIFGVDIVGAAKDGVNAVVSALVGGYLAIKKTWELLPDVFASLFAKAMNKSLDIVQAGVNGIIGALNKIPGIDIGTADLSGFKRKEGDGSAFADIGAAFNSVKGRDWVGDLGTGISNAASGAADKLKDLAAGLTGVGTAATGAGKAAGDAAKGATDPWKGLRKAVGETQGQMTEAAQTAKGFFSTFRQGIMQGKGLWQSLGDAAMGVLNKLMDKAEEVFANALFPSGGGGLFGGGGGVLGFIGSLFGFAGGGYTGPGGKYQPAGVVHAGEYVMTAEATKRIGVGNLNRANYGYAGGGHVVPRMQSPANDTRVQVSVVSRFDANGNFETKVEGISQKQVAKATPTILSHSKEQIVPTMAAYQRDRAGGDYRS